MKIRVKPLLLGSFIIGAVLLVLGALLAFGARNPFQAKGHFVVYLPGSAQGLDKGTGVSFNGVGVGQVDQVTVLYDRSRRRSLVYLLCVIERDRLQDAGHKPIHLNDTRVLQGLVQDGLRAQIQTAGVVGAKFVDLGFYKSSQSPSIPDLPASRYPVVPTTPSTMTEVTQAASQIMENLRKTDFAAISGQIQEVLASVRRQVTGLETNRLTDHMSEAAASIDRLTTSTNIQTLLVRVDLAAASLNALLTNLDTQIVPLGGELGQTLVQSKAAIASIGQTAQDFQDFVSMRNQLGEQTRGLLEQLGQTARTIDRLAGFLEEHPNALISGRQLRDSR